jgi:hypothetical protein
MNAPRVRTVPVSGRLKQRVQFRRDLLAGTWRWSKVAPAIPCAIVRAHACELGDLRLYETPPDRGYAITAIQDDNGPTFARAINVESYGSGLDRPSALRETARVKPVSGRLIHGTKNADGHQEDEHHDHRTADHAHRLTLRTRIMLRSPRFSRGFCGTVQHRQPKSRVSQAVSLLDARFNRIYDIIDGIERAHAKEHCLS